jgi:hypothetical protein
MGSVQLGTGEKSSGFEQIGVLVMPQKRVLMEPEKNVRKYEKKSREEQ